MGTEIDWSFVVACEEIRHKGVDSPRIGLGGSSFYYYGAADGGGWGDGIYHGDTGGNNVTYEDVVEGASPWGTGSGLLLWYDQ